MERHLVEVLPSAGCWAQRVEVYRQVWGKEEEEEEKEEVWVLEWQLVPPGKEVLVCGEAQLFSDGWGSQEEEEEEEWVLEWKLVLPEKTNKQTKQQNIRQTIISQVQLSVLWYLWM